MSTEDKLLEDRSRKLDKLRELGVDPYGGRYDDVQPIDAVRAHAESLNIEDGHDVIVDSPCGTLRGKARVFEGIMPGIISIAAGQGHYASGRWADGMGINPNEITGVDYDRLSGHSVFFNTRVKVHRV